MINNSRSSRLAGIGTLLSLVTCYGTLGLISLLGALGIAIAVDNSIWAGTIVVFALLAVIGLALGLLRHKKPWPLLIGGLGAAIIAYAMYVQYDRLIEISGFVFLSLAALLDWRLKNTGRN